MMIQIEDIKKIETDLKQSLTGTERQRVLDEYPAWEASDTAGSMWTQIVEEMIYHEVNNRTHPKVLVIHPIDRSTDFLKPIYENIPNKTVITGGLDIKEVNKLITEHDRIIMLGHGCPDGLFSIGRFTNAKGLIISDDTVEILKDKECISVWCNADQFMKRHELKGFYSGMFVSEVGESYYCNVYSKRPVVDESNNRFAELLGEVASESIDKIFDHVTAGYGELAKTNIVAGYNNERLYKKVI